ncbi:MAG: peptide ABC transporter substrate-binding protein [Maledivibacter sp.]|jgi:oligopeptide transport system substrate-binding protein|nr:peptide ABC transporter substrate-binding protein [Maledivibacter sp.]
MKKSISILIVVVMIFGLVLSGCSNSTTSNSTPVDDNSNNEVSKDNKEQPKDEQVLNLEFADDMSSLNSTTMAESYANTIIMETQEMLVRMEGGSLKPAGAESWTTSEDGLKWTFKLRDFNWSDGTKVKAQDYAYAVQKMLDPTNACPNSAMFYFIKGAKEYNTSTGKAEDVSVKALDEKTVEFTLNYPVPYFLQLMNFANIVPVRKDIYEACGDTYGQDESKMIFSGPFVVKKWVKGSKIILEKNENYWDADKVKLQTAIINIVKEEPTKMKMFSTKNLDLVTEVKGEYNNVLREKSEAKEITAVEGYSPRSAEIIFNTQDKSGFFTNPKIRLAFSLAIDRDAYIKNIAKEDVAAYGWVPRALLLEDKEYRDVVDGPLKAVLDKDPKKLYLEGLKELGLDESKEQEVTFLLRNSSTKERSKGEFYQDQWEKKLGVKVNVDVASDNATFNQSVMKGTYQICQSGWGADYNDPMNFLEMFETGCGNNGPFFSNEEYDALIDKARKEGSRDKRFEIFENAEKILIAEQAAIAPISYAKKSSYIQNYVKGIELPSFGPKFELKNTYIEGK